MAYSLEGQLLEVCTCKTLCPCWVGEDPDSGTCDGTLAWKIAKGTVNDVDVSGLTICVLAHIPGNILQGNWRAVVYVDDRASPQQKQALLDVWTGKLGGPVGDLVQLVGEVVAVKDAKFTAEVKEGKGTLTVGDEIHAEMEPFKGADDKPTTLHDTIFSTIPGSPAYVSKSPRYRALNKELGLDINLSGHNAVQGSFRFQA
jgi:hypothetical protein